jgi:4-amino-4-deoxy-L-arabinose transferase-like glycosyltransferase
MKMWLDVSRAPLAWACGALLAHAALQMAYNLTLPIYGDEAYYWVWSKHLQPGYFDHPPLVAYLNALFCLVFGDTLLAIRLATVSCLSGAALFIYKLGAAIGDSRSAILALCLFLLTPAANLGFSLHTIDSPLILFWSMALYYGYRALSSGRWRDYLLTGVGLGAALLAKYTAVLFVAFMGLFLLLTRPRELLRPQPWLALTVALLVFSPVLVYNARHSWSSFAYQYAHGSAAGWSIRLDTFGDFFLGQFVVVSPIFMGLLLAVCGTYRFWRGDTGRTYLLASFVFPLGFFLYKALFQRMELNWGVMAFVGAMPLLAQFSLTFRLHKLLLAGVVLALLLDLGMKFPLLFGLRDELNYHNRIFGYQEMALRVLQHRTADDMLFADHLTRASILWFYARQRVFIPTPSRFSEYTRWDQAVEFGKLRGLYVSSSDRMAELQVIFQHVALLETFTVQQAGYLPKRFFLYRVGYRPY